MRRRFLALAAAAAVLAGCSKPAPAPEPVRAVRTLTLTAASAGGTHEFAGEVKARVESRLGFRVGGKITRRAVDLGTPVKAGQVLAEIDPRDLQLGQAAARAAVAGAEVNYTQALADDKRYKQLRDQGFISSAELERRDTALQSAQSQLDQARAQASLQGNQAGYATLVADAPGVITAVDADAGTVVGAGTPVVTLAHDGPRDVVFAVPEDQIALVRHAAQAPGALQVRPWGQGAVPVPATVREVAAAADPATRTFLVKADVGAAALRLGQTATVLLALPRTDGIVKLPLTAVTEQQGRTAVWLVDPATMTVHPQPVQVAGAEGNSVLVRAGLAPGQVVVTAGAHVLSPGQKVKDYVPPRAGTSLASSAD